MMNIQCFLHLHPVGVHSSQQLDNLEKKTVWKRLCLWSIEKDSVLFPVDQYVEEASFFGYLDKTCWVTLHYTHTHIPPLYDPDHHSPIVDAGNNTPTNNIFLSFNSQFWKLSSIISLPKRKEKMLTSPLTTLSSLKREDLKLWRTSTWSGIVYIYCLLFLNIVYIIYFTYFLVGSKLEFLSDMKNVGSSHDKIQPN